MNKPKLREGVAELLAYRAFEFEESDDAMRGMFIQGARWALANLDKLLEPTEIENCGNWDKIQDFNTSKVYICNNGKRVAIVEVEE